MTVDRDYIHSWLNDEDYKTLIARTDRLFSIATLIEESDEGLLFHGGVLTHRAFEEARWCWVNGQFIACTILCQCFVENSLRSMFGARGYSSGESDQWITHSSMKELIEKSVEIDLIDQDLAVRLNQLRKMRNPYIHTRPVFSDGHFMKRVVDLGEMPETLCEEDARQAIIIMFDVARQLGRTM